MLGAMANQWWPERRKKDNDDTPVTKREQKGIGLEEKGDRTKEG